MHVRINRETLATCLDALTRLINGPQLITTIFEIMRPPPKPARDFQNRAGWQEVANPRKDCAVPLRSGTAPRRRPFLPRLPPVLLHRAAGLISPICIHQNRPGAERTRRS